LIALQRYLTTKGLAGACPDWYPVFVAADVCHCAPWELLAQSVYWRDKALIKNAAESNAAKILRDLQK
jgi:hypothetical protein